MRKLNFFHSAVAVLMLAATFVACSNDDESSDAPNPTSKVHYDLTVTVGNHGGMGQDKQGHITLSVASLSDPSATINPSQGAEITDYTMEGIYKGKYIYQVPVSADRFSKLEFVNNRMQVVQEQPFKDGITFTARNYTHAWINDNTLVIMASNGDNNKVIFSKLNTDNMSIIQQGELNITQPSGYTVLTTSGILAYRKSDNKLFYFYYWKTKKRNGVEEPFFHVAVINPETMQVEQDNINTECQQMQGSAYGELLQQIVFFDENDNLYLSAFNDVDGKNIGRLLRIKRGEYNVEAGYNAFTDAKGKLLTVQYLGNGKVFAYCGDNSVTPSKANPSIGDVAYYYSIIDVNNKTVQRVAYNGTDIPYSSGSFSQRSTLNTAENLLYFGVNTASEQRIYIYNVATGAVTQGASITSGFYFDLLRVVEE